MRTKQSRRVTTCLNCAASVEGNFCSHCGQEALDNTVHVRHLTTDFFDQMFGVNSQLSRTIAPLLFRPGFLTNEYNAGKRVRYLSPFRLYFYISVIFFLLFSWRNKPTKLIAADIDKMMTSSSQQSSKPQISDGKKTLQNKIVGKQSAANTDMNAERTPATTKQLIPAASAPLSADKAVEPTGIHFSTSDDKLPATLAEYDAQQLASKNQHKSSQSRIEWYLGRQLIKVKADGLIGLRQHLNDNIPKMMLIMLPFFALLLKLLYQRSKRLYIEHLVFLLHTQAFVFLVMTLTTLITQSVFSTLASLTVPVYIYAALHVVYRQSWLKTFVKFCLLLFGYGVIFILFFLATLIATFLLL